MIERDGKFMSQRRQSSPFHAIHKRSTWRWVSAVAAVGVVAALVSLAWPGRRVAPRNQPAPTFMTFGEAGGRIPDELQDDKSADPAARWSVWVARQDAQVRSRVAKGEEDSLANFLLYGTSFTGQPRITDDYRATLVRNLGGEEAADREVTAVITARAIDLARALAEPREDERLLTMAEVAGRAVRGTRTHEDQLQLAQYLFDNLVRFLDENRAYATEVTAAQARGSATVPEPLSTLYRTRGLSGDTSLVVEYALERALRDVKAAGHLAPDSVRVAGVIGAGLDLIDKQGGYDLYPPQTTQPFVVMDTLVDLGLADANDFRMFTFDISARINGHLERAVHSAREGRAYVLHLVRDDAWGWDPEAVRFWESCGGRVGTVADSAPVAHLAGVASRSIHVRPEWVARLHPIDLNIVCQRLALPDHERFDLLVATNVLCYYDPLQQSLALLNAESMLRPGGILLSTEALPDVEDSAMRRVGSTSVPTSRSGTCVIHWYRRGR